MHKGGFPKIQNCIVSKKYYIISAKKIESLSSLETFFHQKIDPIRAHFNSRFQVSFNKEKKNLE